MSRHSIPQSTRATDRRVVPPRQAGRAGSGQGPELPAQQGHRPPGCQIAQRAAHRQRCVRARGVPSGCAGAGSKQRGMPAEVLRSSRGGLLVWRARASLGLQLLPSATLLVRAAPRVPCSAGTAKLADVGFSREKRHTYLSDLSNVGTFAWCGMLACGLPLCVASCRAASAARSWQGVTRGGRAACGHTCSALCAAEARCARPARPSDQACRLAMPPGTAGRRRRYCWAASAPWQWTFIPGGCCCGCALIASFPILVLF